MIVFITSLLMFTAVSATASDFSVSLTNNSSMPAKEFVLSKSAEIIKAAHKNGVEIYEQDLKDMQCLSDGQVGACIIAGDGFAPNSSSRWIVNITFPKAFECDYQKTKVSFEFMDSEC